MPSHATAQHNSEIRRRQLDGEDITAGDHSSMHAIPTIDNPASPAEFPLTREEYAPAVNRFLPRTAAEREQYEAESEARHRPGDPTNADPDEEGRKTYSNSAVASEPTPSIDGVVRDDDEEEEEDVDGDEEEEDVEG